MSTSPRVSVAPEQLLAHSAFLRRVARGLVYDDRVDDVVQQTWVRAIQYPLNHGANIPAWLATVARTVAARMAHERARAERRFDHAPEPVASPAEIVERVEAQTMVGKAVIALEPPIRDVIVLRYYEALEPGRIAEQLELSVRVVHQRLRTGLEQLRRRLELMHTEGRRDWCVGFAALLTMKAPPVENTPPPLASRQFATKGVIAIAALAATMLLATRPWFVDEPAPGVQPEQRPSVSTSPATLAASLAREEIVPAAELATAELPIRRALFPAEPAQNPDIVEQFLRALNNFRETDIAALDFVALADLVSLACERVRPQFSTFHDDGSCQRWTRLLDRDRLWIELHRQQDVRGDTTVGINIEARTGLAIDQPFRAAGSCLELNVRLAGDEAVLYGLANSDLDDSAQLQSTRMGCIFKLDDACNLSVRAVDRAGSTGTLHVANSPKASTKAPPGTASRVWQRLNQQFARMESNTESMVPVPSLATAFDDVMRQTGERKDLSWLCNLVAIVASMEPPEHPIAYVSKGVEWHEIPSGNGDPTVLFRRDSDDPHSDLDLRLTRASFFTAEGCIEEVSFTIRIYWEDNTPHLAGEVVSDPRWPSQGYAFLLRENDTGFTQRRARTASLSAPSFLLTCRTLDDTPTFATGLGTKPVSALLEALEAVLAER